MVTHTPIPQARRFENGCVVPPGLHRPWADRLTGAADVAEHEPTVPSWLRKIRNSLHPFDLSCSNAAPVARRTRLKITPSSGNVFRDLGFSREEAEHLLSRSDLMIALQKALERRAVKQAEAAKILGVTQPRVSYLLRGRIDLVSTDALIDMLARMGTRVRVVLSRRVAA
jgi:predicted XRE-type DNA-binding protein